MASAARLSYSERNLRSSKCSRQNISMANGTEACECEITEHFIYFLKDAPSEEMLVAASVSATVTSHERHICLAPED